MSEDCFIRSYGSNFERVNAVKVSIILNANFFDNSSNFIGKCRCGIFL
jgi:hypothetical protein